MNGSSGPADKDQHDWCRGRSLSTNPGSEMVDLPVAIRAESFCDWRNGERSQGEERRCWDYLRALRRVCLISTGC